MPGANKRLEGLRIFGWAALGAFAASWFMVALTWDGSYSVFCTLQYQRQMTPHNRWINNILEWPGLRLSRLYDDPAWCARLYGAMSYGIVLASLAVALLVLRGRLARMRKWGVALALMVPMPGILCPCSETIPAAAMFAALMTFVWAGRWWAVPFIAATVWMLWGTHPLATVLFGGAALSSAWMWWQGPARERVLPGIIAVALAVCSVARFIMLLTQGTDYEHSQISAWLLLNEFVHAFIASPWLAVPVAFWLLTSVNARESAPRRRRAMLGMFVVTAVFSLCPVLWNGELDYRKFGAFVATLFAIAGTRELVQPRSVMDDAHLPLRFAQVFACALLVGTFSWTRLCSKLLNTMTQSGKTWIAPEDAPYLKHTTLDHWGATPAAIVLQQTKHPTHGYLCPGSKVRDGGVEMFPVELLELKKAWFDLSALKQGLPEKHP